jgi:hypothetical protein
MPMKFAIVGKFTQADSQAEVNCCPDAFEGGFDVDSFWEYLFADPSYRFVCSASSPSTSFSFSPAASFFHLLHIIKYLSTWRKSPSSASSQVEDNSAEPVAFSSGPFQPSSPSEVLFLNAEVKEGTHYSAVLCCHHQAFTRPIT